MKQKTFVIERYGGNTKISLAELEKLKCLAKKTQGIIVASIREVKK